VELLDHVLAPELLHRGKSLPVPRILALSDDEYLLPGIVAALEFARFQTTSCTSGEKALTALRDQAFDLMLMGTPLPGATLEDARGPLRSFPAGDRLPVVALTPPGMTQPKGVNDALAQPVNLFELTLKANVWVLKYQLELL
jgi:CheY-like chemotaxis protein